MTEKYVAEILNYSEIWMDAQGVWHKTRIWTDEDGERHTETERWGSRRGETMTDDDPRHYYDERHILRHMEDVHFMRQSLDSVALGMAIDYIEDLQAEIKALRNP